MPHLFYNKTSMKNVMILFAYRFFNAMSFSVVVWNLFYLELGFSVALSAFAGSLSGFFPRNLGLSLPRFI